ncbi:MAG: hypothetical protein ABIJ45_01155 [Candidatus Zixiibacteriota bacterium]
MRVMYIRLFAVIALAGILAIGFGCSQSDDIIAPKASTEIKLDAIVLPTLPDGYVYRLWAVAENGGENNVLYSYYNMGDFIWNNETRKYYDTDSNLVDSIFTVEYDLLDDFFSLLAVSVEKIGNDPYSENEPGPVILAGRIEQPDSNITWLKFPADYSFAWAGYCLGTPTDKNTFSGEAGGLWFSYYTYDRFVFQNEIAIDFHLTDTTDLTQFLEIDTSYWICLDTGWDPDTSTEECSNKSYIDDPNQSLWHGFDVDTVGGLDSLRLALDTVGIVCTTTVVDPYYVFDTLRMDSIEYIYVKYQYVTMPINVGSEIIDTFFSDPCTGELTEVTLYPFKQWNNEYNRITTPPDTFLLDKFTPNFDEVPDLNGTKWHYKGWAMSPYLDPDCDQLGKMTKPAWAKVPNLGAFNQAFPYSDSFKIISTGTFKNFGRADDGNPYSLNLRVPSFPGEDFITNLPCGAADRSINFAYSGITYGIGDVFVTIEPDNYNRNTNFPLILFGTTYSDFAGTALGTIPPYSALIQALPNQTQSFMMQNLSGEVPGNAMGFPRIKVSFLR